MSHPAIQHTIQIRLGHLAVLLLAVAAVTAGTTWFASDLGNSHVTATARPEVTASPQCCFQGLRRQRPRADGEAEGGHLRQRLGEPAACEGDRRPYRRGSGRHVRQPPAVHRNSVTGDGVCSLACDDAVVDSHRGVHDALDRGEHIGPRYTFWTRANVSEVLPEPPSPLGWDVVWEGAAVAGWRDLFVQRLGMQDEELDPFRAEMIGIHGGYTLSGRVVVQGVGRPHAGHDADHDRRCVLRRPSRRAAVCRRGLARQRPHIRGDGRLAGMGDDRRHAGRAASRPRRVAANSRATTRPQRAVGRGTARLHRLAPAAVPPDVPSAHQPVDRRVDRTGHPGAGLHCDRRAAWGHATHQRARRFGLRGPRPSDVEHVSEQLRASTSS